MKLEKVRLSYIFYLICFTPMTIVMETTAPGPGRNRLKPGLEGSIREQRFC